MAHNLLKSVQMEEQIHGLTLQTCAEIMARDGELKAQYGERDYKPHLHQFLASQGIDENTWAHSWNGCGLIALRVPLTAQ